MQSLGLDVEVLSAEGKKIKVSKPEDEIMKTVEELGINLEDGKSLLDGGLLEEVKKEAPEQEKADQPDSGEVIVDLKEDDQKKKKKKAKPKLTDEEKEIQKQIEASKEEDGEAKKSKKDKKDEKDEAKTKK